jgi:hypothetical protein
VTRRDCPRDRSIRSKTAIRAAANSNGIHSGDTISPRYSWMILVNRSR